MTCLQAALYYLSRGWNPVVLCPPDHHNSPAWHLAKCKSPGKVPLGRWKQWQTRPTTEQEIRRDFQNQPNGNVGITLGQVAGLIALDIDGPNAARWLARHGNPLKESLSFSTARGARILYSWENESMVPDTQQLFTDQTGEVKLLSQGVQSVMPPSIHPDGPVYTWHEDPRSFPIAEPPSWLLEILEASETTPALPRRKKPLRPAQGPICIRRNDTLFGMAAALRRRGAHEHEIFRCLQVFNESCQPPLPDEELLTIARSTMRYLPAPEPG